MGNIFNKYKRFRSSAIFLICANLIPPAGVYFFNWDVIDILILYLTESAVIGLYHVFKILTARLKGRVIRMIFPKIDCNIYTAILLKFNLLIFFPFHYCAMLYLSFEMINLLADLQFNISLELIPTLQKVWPALVCLTISHGYSFIKNFLKGGERKRIKFFSLLFQPYLRIFVINFTVCFGGYLILMYEQKNILVVILILFKIVIDLIAHIRERIKMAKAEKIK